MKKQKPVGLLTLACMLFIALPPIQAQAFEVLAEQYVVEEPVATTEIVRTADNFLVLFDSSSSMNDPYMNTGKTRIQVAKQLLLERCPSLPNLGWMSGLYTYSPSGGTYSPKVLKPYYEVAPYSKGAFTQALQSLPDVGAGPTPLQKALKELDPILAKLRGQTAVFLFTDGTYTTTGSAGVTEAPADIVKGLAAKYDVCFYVISGAKTKMQQMVVQGLVGQTPCSRAITYEELITRPEHIAGALYVMDEALSVKENIVTRIVAVKIPPILFPLNNDVVHEAYFDELNKLGAFMQNHPDSYVIISGFTDSTGPAEYNLALSQRRAQSVAKYLSDNSGIDTNRMVIHWYGGAKPVAPNDTAEGRQKNRRAMIVLTGLE